MYVFSLQFNVHEIVRTVKKNMKPRGSYGTAGGQTVQHVNTTSSVHLVSESGSQKS